MSETKSVYVVQCSVCGHVWNALENKSCDVCLEARIKHDEWPRAIPVTERLPDEYETVLGFDEAWYSCYYSGRFYSHEEDIDPLNITHWLPMPPPPESEAE